VALIHLTYNAFASHSKHFKLNSLSKNSMTVGKVETFW